MMINLTAVLSIAGGLILVGGSVVTFFVMQNTQNMKIAALEKEVCRIKQEDIVELRSAVTRQGIAITSTDKTIGEINIKLDHILEAIAELKKKGVKG